MGCLRMIVGDFRMTLILTFSLREKELSLPLGEKDA
jgi:hypothetical protein